MARLTSKFNEIGKKLEESGKLTKINSREVFQLRQSINKSMKEYEREFNIKEKKSQTAAAKVVLSS